MTVRARAQLARTLSSKADIKAIWVRSTCRGELQVQVVNDSGVQAINIPPDFPKHSKGLNILNYATKAQWKRSKSLLDAVRLGRLLVVVEEG